MDLSSRPADVAVIGGGIVGLATALALTGRTRATVVVLEAEDRVAAHQTGHNSGVVHSGLYYKPGSLKARNCVAGREALYRFCAEHGIPHDRCGKIVLAGTQAELARLEELERRGRANGLTGLRRLTADEIREYEPHAQGLAALHVPETGIVDYAAVAGAYARRLEERGGQVATGARVTGCRRGDGGLVLETARGAVRCRGLVSCAGLQADRVARLCGARTGLTIVPFRGEYRALVPEREHLVRNLIYPVPDPRFPFLGVHFTRMIRGGVEAGPNAILSWAREGYRRTSFSAQDAAEMFAYPGFWRLGLRHWSMGLAEWWRAASAGTFVAALRRLVPELRREDLRPAGCGVRAQALDPAGRLVDDFRIVEAERMVHVLNAPSPAATASLAIGETIAARVAERLDLAPREGAGAAAGA